MIERPWKKIPDLGDFYLDILRPQCTLACVRGIVSSKAATSIAASMFSARNVKVAPAHNKSGVPAQEISKKGTTDR
jgi:hypothetical protein